MAAPRFAHSAPEIAQAYADLLQIRAAVPEPTAEQVSAWRDLAADSADRAAGIRLLLNVIETGESEPYPDARAMVEDIAAGRFFVSTANCDHPLWSAAENVDFRIVHDVAGHYAATVGTLAAKDPRSAPTFGTLPEIIDPADIAGFDWVGECRACAAHAPLLPTIPARKALFTECLAQTAYAIERGGFGPQVVGYAGAQCYNGVHRDYGDFVAGK